MKWPIWKTTPPRLQPAPFALQVHNALTAAGVEIDGVSIGTIRDKTTWSVYYRPDATPADLARAERIIARFDIDRALR